jgi:predicted PurR-regulated permease PerM
MDNRKEKLVIALILTGVLACAIIYALYPYIEFFLAALILYTLMDPVYKLILKKTRMSPGMAAISVIVLTILLVIIPLYYLLVLLAEQISLVVGNLISQVDLMNGDFARINELIVMFNLEEKVGDIISAASSFLSSMVIGVIQNIGKHTIGLTIMFFLLYYLFITEDAKLRKIVFDITPFSSRNTELLLREMKNITHSTVIATILIAVVQGALLALTFYFVGIQGALFWGFVTAILSIIPVVGSPLVWVPAIVFKIMEADYYAAVIILIAGLVISNIDNVLRALIQKKVGEIHPLESLLGIFIGIYLFGMVGLVVGPMLLASFILILKILNEEYLQD